VPLASSLTSTQDSTRRVDTCPGSSAASSGQYSPYSGYYIAFIYHIHLHGTQALLVTKRRPLEIKTLYLRLLERRLRPLEETSPEGFGSLFFSAHPLVRTAVMGSGTASSTTSEQINLCRLLLPHLVINVMLAIVDYINFVVVYIYYLARLGGKEKYGTE
jgi:hypothetical protein